MDYTKPENFVSLLEHWNECNLRWVIEYNNKTLVTEKHTHMDIINRMYKKIIEK